MGGLTLSGWSCGQAPKSRPALLPTFSYAAASSKQASDLPGGMKRATLLGNANGPTACAGTERDNGMLGRHLFGPGGDYHSALIFRAIFQRRRFRRSPSHGEDASRNGGLIGSRNQHSAGRA